jgi:hypothetical protein
MNDLQKAVEIIDYSTSILNWYHAPQVVSPATFSWELAS